MAKRISQQQFDQLTTTARAAYLKDLEAAQGDSAKVSLADKKLRWAEESAHAALNHRSALYNFFDSIPFFGKPVAMILEHIEKGVAEHGLILGLARGVPIGLVLAASLVGTVEGVTYLHSRWNQHVETRYLASNLSHERTVAMEESNRADRESRIHRAQTPSTIERPVRYYAFDEMRLDARTIGGDVPDFAKLAERDPDILEREPRTLDPGKQVSPFFHYIEPRGNMEIPVVGTQLPATATPAHRDIASVTDPDTHVVYVLAAIGEDHLILVALSDYRASGLPLHEEVDDSPNPFGASDR